MPNIPDVRLIRALWKLELLHGEDLPPLAADALEDGFDGPALRRIAGFIKPNHWEIDPLMSQLWQELGVPNISRDEAHHHYLTDKANQIIAEPERAIEIAGSMWSVWTRYHDHDVWAFLDPMDYGDWVPKEDQRAQILEVAKAFLSGESITTSADPKRPVPASATEPKRASLWFRLLRLVGF